MTIVASMEMLALLGAPPPSVDPWTNVDCNQNAGPGCGLSVGHGHGTVGGAGGPGTSGAGGSPDDNYPECRYEPVEFQDPGGQPPGAGGWFMVLCSPDGKDPLSHGPVWIAAEAGGSPALSPAEVAQLARKRLWLPEPRIAVNPTGDQLVNLPTWLWLSSGWGPVSATASVPGVSVTATATPTSVSWSMGDGGTMTCTGAGTPFRLGTDPKAPSPDCGHIYRTSSAKQVGQAFPVSATVHWTVTWSGAGQSGRFPDLTTTSIAAFRVAESQALNNGSG
jgi:hypothetical protein